MRPLRPVYTFKESNVSCRIMGCGSLAMLPCAHMDYLSGSEGWDCFTATTAQSHCGCIIAKLLLHLAIRCDNVLASVYSHIPTFHLMVTFHFEKFKHTEMQKYSRKYRSAKT